MDHKPKIYIIGSLRNPRVVEIGNLMREMGFDAFDDWYGGGYEADDKWREYEQAKGRGYREALYDRYAKHIFEFDRQHLNESMAGILVLPAGKSGHIEMGYLSGQKKPTFILFDGEPERYDVMYQFATAVAFNVEELISAMETHLLVPWEEVKERLY